MYNKKGRRSLCEVLDSMYLSSFYRCIHDLRALHSSVFEISHLLKKFRGFFYSTLPSQIWKVIFLFVKWEQIYVKLANFHLFQCVFRRKMLTPKVYLQILSMQSFFVYFRKPPKKLSIQSIRRPKWHFISSRCLSSAIPERQYQIFVNYHKPSIHCFISFEALITWPI